MMISESYYSANIFSYVDPETQKKLDGLKKHKAKCANNKAKRKSKPKQKKR